MRNEISGEEASLLSLMAQYKVVGSLEEMTAIYPTLKSKTSKKVGLEIITGKGSAGEEYINWAKKQLPVLSSGQTHPKKMKIRKRQDSYTKKPWRRDGWNIRGVDGSIVAKVLPWDESGCKPEDNWNADLIAAAPYLFEACLATIDKISKNDAALLKSAVEMVISGRVQDS